MYNSFSPKSYAEKLNDLNKFYHLPKISKPNSSSNCFHREGVASQENLTNKNNLSLLKKTKSFFMEFMDSSNNPNVTPKSLDGESIQLQFGINNKSKGSIVIHRLNKLVNLTSAHCSTLAEARGKTPISIKETNISKLRIMGIPTGEEDLSYSENGDFKLLSKGENRTLELLKISEIKKESFLNKTGYLQLFSSSSLAKGKDKTKNYTIIDQYLNNNLQRISPIPDIKTQQKNGILFNYNKTIAFNFLEREREINSSNTKPTNTILKSNSNVQIKANTLNNKYEGIAINKDLFLINKLLFYFFKSLNCLISKPVYLHTPDKVTIQLFYFLNIPHKKVFRLFSIYYYKSFRKDWLNKKSKIYSLSFNKNPFIFKNKRILSNKYSPVIKIPLLKNKVRKAISRLRGKTQIQRSLLFNLRKINLAEVYINKFKILIEILTRKFNKPVSFEIIRIHNPYYDSNILVNLFSLNIRNKRKKSRIAINKIYSNKAIKNSNKPNLKPVNFIPAFLSGLKLKIGGRLMQEPIIPRLTSKNFERGATSPGKVNYLDIANITKKNKKGANTITIKSAQNFF